MTQKDPLLHNSLISFYISREAIHSKKIYLQLNLRNLPAEHLRSLRQNNFEKMIHFTVDSINILAPFLRTAEHTFNLVPRVLSLLRERTLVAAGHVSMHANRSRTVGGFST